MMTRYRPTLLIAALLVSACATVGPDYRAPTPQQLSVPDSYFGAAPAPSAADAATWWHRLDDPLLDSLVDRGLAGNLDLQIAAARLRQAREGVVQARAGRVPSVGVSGNAGQNVSVNGSDNRSFSVGADASWEADLFGGVTRAIEAAEASADAAGYDAAAARVSITSEIVSNYIQARLAQQRLAVARETLAITEDNLQIAGWRVQAGLVSSLDVEQARGQRAQTAATIPTLEAAFSSAAYRLGVLTGQPPAALIGELQTARPVPEAPATVAVGIPAETLRQRPDVRSAERSLAAETARIGIAEAELRPGLRLSGNIGTSALSIGGLVDQVVGGLFAGLSQSLFDGGRLRSQVRSQQAAADAALATYRQSVLTALEDVENGLVSLDTAKQRRAEFTIALEAANNQAILARSQYRAGLSDFQTLLEAERALLSAREGLLSSQADQTLAVVQLTRALGGGWDSAPLSQDQTR
jgi:outer membrane protein, multidrug efflux system